MENIKVSDIVAATGGALLCGEPGRELSHISIDSRKMKGNDLFVPLVGEKNNAHRFLNQAMENGAKAALTSEHSAAPNGFAGALIQVEDTGRALKDIGSYLRERLSLPLIGITGSVGKTTTREMVAAALFAGFKVFKTPANHNSQIGVPLTISEISGGDEIGVLELGMSEPGEMTVIAKIARVDMAVITNVGVTHIENLGSRENILREKLNIQDGLRKGGILFLNRDNDLLRDVKARDGYRTIYYGTGEDCDYRAAEIELKDGMPCFVLEHEGKRIPIRLRVMGAHNVLNALAALAVADQCHVDLEAAAEKLADFDGFQNRQKICRTRKFTVVDDTYNASPDSMKAGIRVLADLAGKRRIAVLADMKELGPDAPGFHYEIGRFILTQPVDLLVTYGELAREIARAVLENTKDNRPPAVCFEENERQKLLSYLERELRPGDACLFKGSNSMRLKELADYVIRLGEGQAEEEPVDKAQDGKASEAQDGGIGDKKARGAKTQDSERKTGQVRP